MSRNLDGEPLHTPDQVRGRLSPDCAPRRRQDEAASRRGIELYRQEKINPLAGCLPIAIQIPVFINRHGAKIELFDNIASMFARKKTE